MLLEDPLTQREPETHLSESYHQTYPQMLEGLALYLTLI